MLLKATHMHLDAPEMATVSEGLLSVAGSESDAQAQAPAGLVLSSKGLLALQQQAALFGEQLGLSRAQSLAEVMGESSRRQGDERAPQNAAEAAVSHETVLLDGWKTR